MARKHLQSGSGNKGPLPTANSNIL